MRGRADSLPVEERQGLRHNSDHQDFEASES